MMSTFAHVSKASPETMLVAVAALVLALLLYAVALPHIGRRQ